MSKILHIFLVFLFSCIIFSCGEKEESKEESTTTTSAQVLCNSCMGGSIQGIELSLSTSVSTLAGTFPFPGREDSHSDGTGTSASFYRPQGITTDGTNLYVTDSEFNLIRQIVISTAVVTTLAGKKIDGGGGGSEDGTGTSASFNSPLGITTDGTNLYVADGDNHLIRKIVISTAVVTTLAGTGSSGKSNGTGTSASFNYPDGITTDGTNLYVTDRSNHLIRKIVISTAVVTTLAGTGSPGKANGTGTSASFNYPRGITTDGTNLYVADGDNHLIRKIVISTGAVTKVAGTGYAGSHNDADCGVGGCIGSESWFRYPGRITTDGTNIYVTDLGNHRIRKIVISSSDTGGHGFYNRVSTVAGTASTDGFTCCTSGSADNSTGTSASFYLPKGITTDGTNLYVLDMGNNLIRKIE